MKSPFIRGSVPKPETTTLPLPNPATPLLRQNEMWLGQNIPRHQPLIKQRNQQAFNLEWTSCTAMGKEKTYQQFTRELVPIDYSTQLASRTAQNKTSTIATSNYSINLVFRTCLNSALLQKRGWNRSLARRSARFGQTDHHITSTTIVNDLASLIISFAVHHPILISKHRFTTQATARVPR